MKGYSASTRLFFKFRNALRLYAKRVSNACFSATCVVIGQLGKLETKEIIRNKL